MMLILLKIWMWKTMDIARILTLARYLEVQDAFQWNFVHIWPVGLTFWKMI